MLQQQWNSWKRFRYADIFKRQKRKEQKKLAIVLFIYLAKFLCFHSNLSTRVSFHLIAMSNLQRPEAFLNRLSEQ